jgi:hypothetical protein
MSISIDFRGQWIGYFTYGPEYGEDVAGEKVQFIIFVDSFNNGEFVGRSVDTEGIGATFEVAQLKGFIEDNFISFTKQYPHFYGLDEAGNTVADKTKQHPMVSYAGEYNAATKTFSGQWELRLEIAPVGEYWLEDICTGSWEIHKDD